MKFIVVHDHAQINMTGTVPQVPFFAIRNLTVYSSVLILC